MNLDADALQTAQEVFDQFLRSEAKQQHAYLAELPDGRISLELEWLDVTSITRAVVAAYLERVAEAKNSAAP